MSRFKRQNNIYPPKANSVAGDNQQNTKLEIL